MWMAHVHETLQTMITISGLNFAFKRILTELLTSVWVQLNVKLVNALTGLFV